MPESADRSGRPDWSGQAAGNGGAAEAPADDWLRAELDDEYPLPPLPAPRPRLAPQPQPQPQPPAPQPHSHSHSPSPSHSQSQPEQGHPPAPVLPPAAPRFGEAAQSTGAPVESLLGQPAALPHAPTSPPSAPPSVLPTVPPSVLQTSIVPGGAPSATPHGEVSFGAQPEQRGHPDQHEPHNHIEQPLPEWVIVLSDGVSLPIYGPVVIGRNPSQERFPDASVSAVPDLTQTMSKTHARFWVDGDRLYVDDLNSTNGVALFPGGNAHGALAVEPGVPAELRSGDVVQLGEYRLSIRRS